MSSVPWIFGDGGTNLGVGLIPVHSFSLHPASHIKVQFICISASGRCLSELDVLRVATFVRGCVKALPSIDRRCCLRWSPRCGGYSSRLFSWSGHATEAAVLSFYVELEKLPTRETPRLLGLPTNLHHRVPWQITHAILFPINLQIQCVPAVIDDRKFNGRLC